ncbi:MAG: MarR family transcriptional regulator [Alphaproteobacteria bacterium]|nr:MarR family transcriptional regulator [Alphaproteobacteria bacterium]
MKVNPLFLSTPAVERDIHAFYQAFCRLRSLTLSRAGDDDKRQANQLLLVLLQRPASAKRLAEDLNISKQALHQQLQLLRKKKWLQESTAQEDRRKKLYQLTPLGMTWLQESILPAVKKLAGIYQQAGGEAAAGFVTIIESLGREK